MQKKVIIIGAGVAGLTAGCYALKNGFSAFIVEKNSYPGGLCQSLFQPLLQGISPKYFRYNPLKELSIESNLTFLHQDYITSIYQEDGRFFHLSTDLSRLKESFLTLSPDDSTMIISFFEDVKLLSELTFSVQYSKKSLLSLFTFKKLQNRYKMPPWKYALQFHSLLLADIFTRGLSVHDQSLFSSMLTLASYHTKNCAVPNGGSNHIISILENEYKERGGKISYSSPVTKILVEKNKACGVILANGDKIISDGVVSCADGHTTLFEWIDKKYLTFPLKEIYKKLEPFPPILLLTFILDGNYFSTLPSRFILSFPQSIPIIDSKIDTLSVENYQQTNPLSPEGKTFFYLKIPTNWNIWKEWHKDEELYQNKKLKIRDNVIYAISTKFPSFPSEIISSTITTPIDFYSQTGNFQGSYRGFMSKEKKPVIHIPQNLPFLKYFYMAGHWTVLGGGIYEAALSARNAIKKLCQEYGTPFKI